MLTWLINPIVLGSIIVFIAFWLIIVRGQLKRYFRESNKLKEEFDKYRREMQLKVGAISLIYAIRPSVRFEADQPCRPSCHEPIACLRLCAELWSPAQHCMAL